MSNTNIQIQLTQSPILGSLYVLHGALCSVQSVLVVCSLHAKCVQLHMLRPTVIHKKMSGFVKSAYKIENYIGILIQNAALCLGMPNQPGAQSAGAQFAAPGAQFARATKSVGPNSPRTSPN